MQQVSADEAKEHLAEVIEAAVKGEIVLITRDDEQVVRLVPITRTKRRRKAGSAQGLIVMSDDFDAPLEDFEEYMQ